MLVHLSLVLEMHRVGFCELKTLGTLLMVPDLRTKCVEKKARMALGPKAMSQVPILCPALLDALLAVSERLDLPPLFDDDGLQELFTPKGEPPRSVMMQLVTSSQRPPARQAGESPSMMREEKTSSSACPRASPVPSADSIMSYLLPQLDPAESIYQEAMTAVLQLLESFSFDLEQIAQAYSAPADDLPTERLAFLSLSDPGIGGSGAQEPSSSIVQTSEEKIAVSGHIPTALMKRLQ